MDGQAEKIAEGNESEGMVIRSKGVRKFGALGIAAGSLGELEHTGRRSGESLEGAVAF